MVFETDDDESSAVTRNYIKFCVHELQQLKKEVFQVKLKSGETRKVEFKVGENDMKYVSFISVVILQQQAYVVSSKPIMAASLSC